MKKIILSIITLIPFIVFAQVEQDTIKSKTETIVQIEIETGSETKSEDKKKKNFGTVHSLNIDLGINNYHTDGKFPDEENKIYGVRSWGSWYVGLTSLQRSHLNGGLFLEWGAGISWYNFKFQEDNLILQETPTGVEFSLSTETFNYEKSKLTVSYVNLYFVPVYQFGQEKYTRNKKWSGCKNYDERGLRIGFGGYGGYRIGSHTKVKYEELNGDEEKKLKDHDNFYLQNLRYGLRLQLGYKGTDIFFNYDLNDLFSDNRGPELSAISFGFIL